MSNFDAPAIHPVTGETYMCHYLGDYFGKHKYGVQFPDGEIYPEEDCPEGFHEGGFENED